MDTGELKNVQVPENAGRIESGIEEEGRSNERCNGQTAQLWLIGRD